MVDDDEYDPFRQVDDVRKNIDAIKAVMQLRGMHFFQWLVRTVTTWGDHNP